MLDEVVKRAAAELRARDRARDEILSFSRRARMLSKQAILLSHGCSLKEAGEKIGEAKQLLAESEPYLEEHAELRGFDEVRSAREEYAEASILHGLKMRGNFPKPEDVGVPLQIYLLGLGDVVGELRRGALDALRGGDLEAAEAELGIMEHIYLSLLSMDETSLLLRGMRRKLDVARGVIERTRGELTAEAGRRRLSKALKQLVNRLDENQS
jgi:translin